MIHGHVIRAAGVSALILAALSGDGRRRAAAAADAVYVNGKVFTADAKDHVVQGFAVAGDRFLAVGSNAANPQIHRQGHQGRGPQGPFRQPRPDGRSFPQ